MAELVDWKKKWIEFSDEWDKNTKREKRDVRSQDDGRLKFYREYTEPPEGTREEMKVGNTYTVQVKSVWNYEYIHKRFSELGLGREVDCPLSLRTFMRLCGVSNEELFSEDWKDWNCASFMRTYFLDMIAASLYEEAEEETKKRSSK